MRVARCHYTEEFLREDLQIVSPSEYAEVNVADPNRFEDGIVVDFDLMFSPLVKVKMELRF